MSDRSAGRSSFERDGYVQIQGFVDSSDVASLREAIERAVERDPEVNPLSSGAMRFRSNLFYSEPVLQEFLTSARVVDLVTAHGGPDLWVRWDQAVWKYREAPEFPWHQDNGYTGLEPTHLQLWVALTPMRHSDGGLVIAPGRHRRVEEHRWQGSHVVMATPSRPRVIEAAPGDVLLFSSKLPHMTAPNTSGRERLTYVAEFLPIGVPDRSVRAPHLVVARNGQPDGQFTDLFGSWSNDRTAWSEQLDVTE